MEEGLVAVPVVWKYPGREVYVTGDLNAFAMTELVGEQEKTVVFWLRPGLYFYRFLVDGSFTFDPLKDCVREDSAWYNRLVVDKLPEELSFLSSLSLEQMEEMDKALSVRKSSYSSIDSSTPDISVPQSTVPERLGFSENKRKRTAARTILAWWLRNKVSSSQFRRQRKAAIVLQRKTREWLQRQQSRKQPRPSVALQTDLTAKELQSLLQSLQQANTEKQLLAQESTRLHKELQTHITFSEEATR